jgi:hypothetical protein
MKLPLFTNHGSLCYYGYMFDKNTIPEVTITPAKFGDFSITKEGNIFYLRKNEAQLMQLNTKTLREYKEQYACYDLAYGDVLITGLGFGMLATWLAAKPEVTSVKVIEFSQEVIDLFTSSNPVPEKITIELGNANNYATSDKFDCMFLDHFPDHSEEPIYSEILSISKNIPNHDVLWFWSLEKWYLENYYGLGWRLFFTNPPDLSTVNLYDNWQKFKSDISVLTVPTLDPVKVKEYIYSSINYIAIQ